MTNWGGVTFLDTNYCATSISVNSAGLAGAPDASVIVNRCRTADLGIATGRANTFVRAYGNLMTGSYAVRTGEPGTALGGLYVIAGRTLNAEPWYLNRITVEATYNVAPRGKIQLGDGDDSLALIGNAIGGTFDVFGNSFDLDGFGGVNRLFELGNSYANVTRRNFVA